MGILNLKKKKADLVPEVVKETPKMPRKLVVSEAPRKPAPATGSFSGIAGVGVIIRPRVTEKAGVLSAKGREVYVFEVSKAATKRSVSEAIRFLYKVSPEKVAILKVPPKKSMVRGRMSRGKTGRKAYVYLRTGEKIETI